MQQSTLFTVLELTNRQVRRVVLRAKLSGRLLRILYRDAGGNETVRSVAVLGLERFRDGTTQFEAFCLLRGARRIFYVGRVQAIETLAERWSCYRCGEPWRAADEDELAADWAFVCSAGCSEAV